MSLSKTIFRIVAPASLLLVGACATSFKADVSRFQRMPPPQGQTFAIQAANPQMQGGIEFGMYAQMVATRLAQLGYTPSPDGRGASLVVSLDYGIDNGHEKVVTTPGLYGGYGGWGRGWGYGGFGGFGGGFGRGYYGRGWGMGWGDPYWAGGPDVESYTFYVSHLDMRIRRAADGVTLFEGRAKARSVDHSLQRLVPNLVEAMFTGFPGRSGEDVLITVPPPPKDGSGPAPVNRAPINSGPTA
ncbi:DUF4136 domain-containing protein [Sphingomonas nostoxanthinifaciens]|uniref:DUF4136 domain-containing protein n=1 Tax=Sphingomonas nostoxanthinifaciens TaxID=2872652 RepID=UPI001CC21607|nr:DUF4136 domain-containing protein [Sphingomonas nostoxanthinifaciens]UAK25985.1 DUF4136 domain-containing protein [Sphingomonas nostoxanthinifaciens]